MALRSITDAQWLYIAPAAGFLFTAGMRVLDHQPPQCETDQARPRTIRDHGRSRIVCMTARLDVTPKTTEQNRIVRTVKSEAEVTNNKQELSYRKQIARKLRTQYDEGIYRSKYYTVTLKSR